jgi:hypothetical protein
MTEFNDSIDHNQIFCSNTIEAGLPIRIKAAGISMWPLITKGMKAEISSLSLPFPKKSDLLLIRLDDLLVVHRCWGTINKNGIPLVLTKGDSNLVFDPPIPLDRVVGQVTVLHHPVKGSKNPNRGLLRLYGKLLCSSKLLAGIWARACRLTLKFSGN